MRLQHKKKKTKYHQAIEESYGRVPMVDLKC